MTRTTITTAVAALALVAAAPALAAEVSPQTTVAKAGAKAPVEVPGTGMKKGGTLRSGQTMIARTVTLEGREQPRTTLKCPAGAVFQGLGPDSRAVGFVVTDKGSYGGKRTVHLRAYAVEKRAGEGTGTIYGLCRRA